MQPSDEATPRTLELAREQGDAYAMAVAYMEEAEAHGMQRRAGDYAVGVAVEHAEGMYLPVDGDLRWCDPHDVNAHVEVVVSDAADGRFVPQLGVVVTVRTPEGIDVGTERQPFTWHPWLHHYGRNWRLPGDGNYEIIVRVEPPAFPRHDRTNGRRYAAGAEVSFDDVWIETGVKGSTDHLRS